MTLALRRLLAAVCLVALPLAALAQSARPVKIIIGIPAGGPLDAHARVLAERVGQALGAPVIIDYKAGAEMPTWAKAVKDSGVKLD